MLKDDSFCEGYVTLKKYTQKSKKLDYPFKKISIANDWLNMQDITVHRRRKTEHAAFICT